MISAKGFFDLCIQETCFVNCQPENVLKEIYDLGYRTIAINQTIYDNQIDNKKKKKKGEPRENNDIVPAPLKFNIPKECQDLMILNRLTICFSTSEAIYKVSKSSNFKKYQILAALPTTQPAFLHVCNNFEADILTVDPEAKTPLKCNRKMYRQLCDRGYHLEILYSPAIEDYTKRKNLIHLSHLYHTFGKSKNIILSSGASSSIFVRSPYDVINLGLIFGLNEQEAKNAVSHFPLQVYIRSVGRNRGKAVIYVENVDEPLNQDASVIALDSSDEEMDMDQPSQKKSKQ